MVVVPAGGRHGLSVSAHPHRSAAERRNGVNSSSVAGSRRFRREPATVLDTTGIATRSSTPPAPFPARGAHPTAISPPPRHRGSHRRPRPAPSTVPTTGAAAPDAGPSAQDPECRRYDDLPTATDDAPPAGSSGPRRLRTDNSGQSDLGPDGFPVGVTFVSPVDRQPVDHQQPAAVFGCGQPPENR
jgi:hypothetical protein